MMHEVIDHHDGHYLTEAIHVLAVDEPEPGGAHYRYEFYVDDYSQIETETDPPIKQQVGYLQFQRGPRNEPSSTPGVLTVAVLAALIDIQRDFQSGPYPSREGEMALQKLQEALLWLRARADDRARREVLGYNKS